MTRMTRNQIKYFGYLISKSQIGDENSKKVMLWLLSRSDRLSKSVCLCLAEAELGELPNSVLITVHNMKSANDGFHINEIMKVMNTKFRFSVHAGCYEGDVNPTKHKSGITIWLSEIMYDKFNSTHQHFEEKMLKTIHLVEWDDSIDRF